MASELSRRIKYAMAHLSRKQYTSLLARPNWRRIKRRDENVLPNPFGIRRTALKARASKRIKVMARPKHVSKKYDPETAPPSYPRIHPKTLEAKTTKRIMDLALPQRRTLLANMRFQTSGNITETLWKVQNSRYRKYRYFCNARLQREARKRQRIQAKLRRAVKPDEWQQHLESMERLATPKTPPKPKPIGKKKKWRRANAQRIEELSAPMSRELPDVRDPFVVPASALNYNITERVAQLARHRDLPAGLPPRIPGTVSKTALAAQATPRLIILAKPAERPAGMETDLREDAFTVSPQALKARCSRRLKMLARPKTYRK
ncbi:testicular haploid expressed gene [Lasioglossum baleicum]|uniref:testicular haploid expressed gene n=1 Tax=Lasioglossum baleicum TaxID=434251 RepID=UPI003FCC3595